MAMAPRTLSRCRTSFMDALINAYISAWKRSFEYTGRSNRGDYWWFFLANFIIAFVLQGVGIAGGFLANIANLYLLVQIVPHLSLTVRRLRDAGKAWQWILLGLVPIAGLYLLWLLVQPSVGIA
jgi:uncharacterized membrane protein YhaH (DUF805 family)